MRHPLNWQKNIAFASRAKHLDVTASATCIEPDMKILRTKNISKLTHILRKMVLHCGNVKTNSLIRIY